MTMIKPFTIFLEEYIMEKRQKGEGRTLFHYSRAKNPKSHYPMTHYGNKEVVRTNVSRYNDFDDDKMIHTDGSLQGVRIKHGKSYRIHSQGSMIIPRFALDHLHKLGLFNKKEHKHLVKKFKKHVDVVQRNNPNHRDYHHDPKLQHILAKAIRGKGYQSLHYTDHDLDSGWKQSHIATLPHKQVRIVKNRRNPKIRRTNDNRYYDVDEE